MLAWSRKLYGFFSKFKRVNVTPPFFSNDLYKLMIKTTKVKYYTTVPLKYLDKMKLMGNFIAIYVIIIFCRDSNFHFQYTNLAKIIFFRLLFLEHLREHVLSLVERQYLYLLMTIGQLCVIKTRWQQGLVNASNTSWKKTGNNKHVIENRQICSLDAICIFHEDIKKTFAWFWSTDMNFDKIFLLFKQIKH